MHIGVLGDAHDMDCMTSVHNTLYLNVSKGNHTHKRYK
jgi:hypothetical protein